MYTLKLKAVFLLTLLISSTVLVADTHPKRILFIGNSYLYYNVSIHNHVKRMLVDMALIFIGASVCAIAKLGPRYIPMNNK